MDDTPNYSKRVSRFQETRARMAAFWASSRGRTVRKVLQWSITAGVVAYLVVRLTSIGWSSIVAELPTTPLFYLFFLLLYFSLPLSEVVVYRIVWGKLPAGALLRALIRKRVLNRDVLGYSGEVFLYGWAAKNVAVPEREILKSIRDTNIVSSVASTLVAVVLLGVFLYLGHFSVRSWIEHQPVHYVLMAAAGIAVVGAVVWRFRRYLFAMTLKVAMLVFGVYAVRLILGQVLQIGQWAVVLPEIPLGIWFTFAAVSLVLSRIPFIPNQDLVFLGAGVEMSTMLDVPTAAIAGMLLVVSVLDKGMNLALFTGISIWERRRGHNAAVADVSGADPAEIEILQPIGQAGAPSDP